MNNDYVIDEIFSAELKLETNRGDVKILFPHIIPHTANLEIGTSSDYITFNPRDLLRTNNGGKVCFSFNTIPDKEIFIINLEDEDAEIIPWEHENTSDPDTETIDKFLESFEVKEVEGDR